MLGKWARAYVAIAALALFVAAPLASANLITPGTSTGPVFAPMSLAGTTILDTISGGYNTPGGSVGTYTTAVLREPGGPGSPLDFIYQFTQTSGPALDRSVAFPFTGLTTDVGVDTDVTAPAGFSSTGTVSPSLANRDATGAVVGFDFVLSSATTKVFVIKTNATIYGRGLFLSVQNGGSQNLVGFAPVPLPATANMGLVLLGSVGGLGALRRLKNGKNVEA